MKIKALALTFIFVLVSSASYGFFWSTQKDLYSILNDIETKGADDASVAELVTYIEDNPRGSLADEAMFRLAGIYASRKDYGKAISVYTEIIDNFPDSRFKPDSLYEIGSLEYKTGHLDEAKAALEAIQFSSAASVTVKVKASLLLKEISSASFGLAPRLEAPAIGVLLPLKGPYAQFGEDALLGTLMAADVFGEDKGPVEVVVSNVGADPAAIESAINELADKHSVVGIVGPLLSSTAFEATRYAHNRKVPIITLSQKEGLTDGEYVFRNFLTPESQAAAIADYACKTLGRTRTAILYPQNNYGSELARLFENDVKALGCEVVKTASYPKGTTDFTDHMKRLFGIEVKERMEGRRKIKEYTSTEDIDSLFIPDSADTVGLIAPYLDFYNIKGIQLLGSNAWNSKKLTELAGENLEGAVFVDGFFIDSQRPETVDFVARFKATFGRDPGLIEAQAYDAATAFIAVERSGPAGFDRDAVKDALKRLSGVTGATGKLSFNERGEAVKKLFILTVKKGRIEEAPVQ